MLRVVQPRRASLPAVLGLALALAVSTTANAASWSDPVALGPWGTGAVEIINLGDGNLVAAISNWPGRLVIKRSDDGGKTWVGGPRLGVFDESEGSYSVSGEGQHVDAIWHDERWEGDELRQRVWYSRSDDGGVTFGNPRPITPRSAPATLADVARDATGHVVVAWTEYFPAYDFPRTSTVRLRVSSDGGQTFGPIRTIGTGQPVAAASVTPAVVITNGVVYLVYSLGGPKLRVGRSTDWGATWRSALVATHAQTWGRPSLSVDGDDVYVAYSTKSGAVGYRRSLDGGKTWSDFHHFAEGWSPVIVATDDGVDAAYIREGRDWWDFSLIYRHSRDGRTWGPAEERGGAAPSLARLDGSLVMLYQNWNGGDVGRVTRAEVSIRRD